MIKNPFVQRFIVGCEAVRLEPKVIEYQFIIVVLGIIEAITEKTEL